MPRASEKKAGQPLLVSLASAIIFIIIYFGSSLLLTALVYLAYHQGYVGSTNYTYLTEVASLISLSVAVAIYLLLYKRAKPSKAASALGLVPRGMLGKVGLGILIFMAILVFELLIGVISSVTNVPINTNVSTVLKGAPLWFYIYTAIIEPINEEIMFRGFLVPRVGMLASSVVFGLAHYTYYSTFGIEVIAAFIFGMLAAYAFKKTKSIYPGTVAHILVNSLAVIGLLGMS